MADVHLDNVRVTLEVGVPDAVEHFALGHHLSTVTQQVLEHSELAGGHVDHGVATGDASGGRVETNVAGLQHRGTLRSAPPQQCTDTSKKDRERKRFAEVVVGTGVERFDLVPLAVFGGEHQNRGPVALCAQRLADAVTADAGKHDVEQDDRVAVLLGHPESVGAGRGHIDGKSLRLESPAYAVGKAPFVFNHQHAHVSRFPSTHSARSALK